MLSHLIGSLSVKALTCAQLLHELPAQLSAARLLLTLLIELAQPLMGASYDKLAKAHALPPTSQRVKGLMDTRRLSDRVTREAGRHDTSVAPGTAPSISAASHSLRDRNTGRPGQVANLEAALERLLEALMEPIGREARRKAADAICKQTH